MQPSTILWNRDHRLVLASKSVARRQLLEAAGLPFEIAAARVDERAIEADFLRRGGVAENLASTLASAKAIEVSRRYSGALCLGADQALSLEGDVIHKASNVAEAANHIARLAGQTHRLVSAFALAKDGHVRREGSEVALMTMRPLDRAQIERYLDCAGSEALASVGSYQVEKLGVHLFGRIEGEHSVILGLPMIGLLECLRAEGAVLL